MSASRGKAVSEAAFRRLWLDPAISAQQIADHLGITVQALRFRAMARGLPKRKGGGGANRRIDPALFRAMWEANVGAAEIAAFFGVHPTSISKRRRAWGLPDRDCTRWNALSIVGFFMAREARATEAALDLAEMRDNIRKAA